MKSSDQKEARKKNTMTRNDKRIGMWSVQSRERGHRQGETLPMATGHDRFEFNK